MPAINIVTSSNRRCATDLPNTLTANPVTPAPTATYQWLPGPQSGSVVQVSPVVTTIYTVVGTQSGCTNTATQTITVDPNPAVTITPAATAICIGAPPIPLQGNGAATYVWQPGTLTTQTINVSPPSTRTYTLTGTSAVGCTGTATAVVTVNSLPVISTAPTAQNVCITNLPAAIIASGASTYVWQPGALVGTIVSVNPPAGNNTFTVVGTDGNGCTGSNTASVNVVATPALPSVVTGLSNACRGQRYIYSVTPVAGQTYVWSTTPNTSIITLLNPAGDQVEIEWQSVLNYTIDVYANRTVGSASCDGPPRSTGVTVIDPPAQPGAISGPIVFCPNDQGTYTVGSVPGATSYDWAVIAGPIGGATPVAPSTTNTISYVFSLPGTYAISVAARNTCGPSAIRTLNLVVNSTPLAPTVVGSTSPICPGALNATYSVVNIAGTTYQWNLPAGVANIQSGQGTSAIVVNWSPTIAQGTYNIDIIPTRLNCVGASVTIPVIVNPSAPAQPGPITGPTPVCRGDVATYSVAPVANATTYNWTGLPAGAVISAGVGTNAITINWGTAAAGSVVIGVTASNSCGTSPFQGILVVINAPPATPGVISAPAVHCEGTSASYTVAPVANADDYTWTNSCTGWTGTSTINQIDYVADANGPCVITVSATNVCGTSAVSSRTIMPLSVPSQPGPVNGPTPVCRGDIRIYTVPNIVGTSYIWSGLPAGASVLNGQGTNTVEINWGTAAANTYNIRVTPSNACGASTQFRELPVVVRSAPTAPTGFTGPTTLCQGSSGSFAIVSVPGVTYVWSASPAGATITPQGSAATIVFGNAGSFQLVVTPTNSCGTGSPLVSTIQITAPPTVNAGNDRVVCSPNPVLVGMPQGGTWTCEFCPGTSQVQSAGSFGLVSGLGYGPHVFRYSVNDANCGVFDDFVLVENDRIVAGSVTGSSTVCEGSTGVLTLAGQTSLARVIRWEFSTDNFNTLPTPIQNNTPSHTYVGLTQTTQFRVVLQGERGACAEQFSALGSVIVTPRAISTPGPALQEVCGTTATLNGNLPNASTGEWLYVRGPSLAAQVVTIGAQGQVIGLSQDGDHVFRWRVGNSVCGFSTQEVVVRKVPGVTQAIAGAFQKICEDTARVVGNSIMPWETAEWTILQAPASSTPFVTNTGRVGLFEGLTAPGKYIFEYTINNTLCGEASRSQIEIERLPSASMPVVPANMSICANAVQLTGNIPTEGIGTWSYTAGPSIPTLAQVGPTINVTNLDQSGLHFFRYTIDNGVCPANFSDVEITIVQGIPTAAVTSTQVDACGINSPATLQAIAPTAGTGTWRFVTGPSTPQVVTSGTIGLVTGLSQAGDYEFVWEVMNACGMASASVTVRVLNINFTPAFGGSNQAICARSEALVAGNSVPPGGIGRWRFVSGPATASVTTFGNRFGAIENMDTDGEYVFEWEISLGNCAPSVSQVKITRRGNPTMAFAGTNQIICGSTANLQGNAPVIGTGSWSYINGPSSPINLNSTSNQAVASGLTRAGLHEFEYTISNAPCPASRSRVYVTVNPTGQPGLLSMQSGNLSVCSGSNSGTLQLMNHVGNILRWESSEDDFVTFNVIPITSTVNSFQDLIKSTSFRVIVKSGNCGENPSNVVKITVRPTPGVANAGPTQSICGTTATLTGNAPAPGVTGTWTYGGGPPTANPAISNSGNQATVTGLDASGDYIFRWTFDVPGCGTSTSNVLVRVSIGTNGGSVSSDATVCGGSNGNVLTLSGQRGNVVRWERSTDNWTSVLPTITTATTFVYSNITQSTKYRAIVKEGNCMEMQSTEVTITVTPAVPAANAGPDQTICAVQTELNGNGGGVSVGSWIQASGPVSTLQPVGSRLTVRDMTPGVYVFEYSLNNGVCGTTIDQAIVTVNAPSVGGTVSAPATVCAGTNSGSLSLTGAVGTIVRWERSTNNFASAFPIANTLSSLNWSSLNTTTRYRAVVKNGTCAAANSDAVEINVVPATPAATITGGPATTCNSSVDLTGSMPGSGMPMWTLVSGPGTPVLDPTGNRLTVRNLGVGVTTIQYQIMNAPCTPTTATTTITRVNSPVGGSIAASVAQVCGGTNSVTFTLSGETGTVVRWESTTDGFSTTNPITNTTNTLVLNNLTLTTAVRAIVTSGSCGTEQSLVAIVQVVGPLPVANAGLDQTVCSSSVVLSGNSPSSGTGTWSQTTGAATSTNQNGTEFSVNGLTTGTYTFRYEISGAPCVPTFDEVTVTVTTPSVAGVVTASVNQVCAPANSGFITVTGHTGAPIAWEYSTDGFGTTQTDNVAVTIYPFTNLTQTTQFRAVIANGNCPPVLTNPITIVVDQPSLGGVVASDVTVCINGNSGNLGLTSQRGTILRWESTTSIAWSPIVNSSPTQPFLNLMVSESFRAVVKNGVCPEVNSTPATVTVSTGTIAGTVGGFGTVCSGTNSSVLTLSGQNGNVVNWEASTDAGFNPVTVINQQTPTLSVSGLTTTTYYRAVVRSGTCTPATTAGAAIIVNPPSNGGTVSGAATVCAGTNSGILTVSGQVGTVVRWELSTNSFTNTTTVSNMSTSLSWSNLITTTCYKVVVRNGGCAEAESAPVCITVNAVSVGGSVGTSQTVCATGNSGTFSLTGNVGNVVRWESSLAAAFTTPVPVTNVTSSLTFTNVMATTWYRAVVMNGSCAEAFSSLAKVTVDQASSAGTVSGALSVCGGTAAGTLLVSGHVGDVVRWEASSDDFNNNMTTAQTGNTPSLAYNTSVTRWYRVAVRNGVCGESLGGSVKVDVASPTVGGVLSGASTACGGTNSGILTLTGQTGSVTGWEFSTSPAFSNPQPIANTTATLAWSNLNSTTYYRAVVKSGTCSSVNSSISEIRINPTVTLVAGSVVGCTGAASITAIAGGGAGGFVYTLTPSAASNISGQFNNVTPGVYAVMAQDVAGCSKMVSNIVVGTSPTPTQIISVSNVTETSAVVQWAPVQPTNGVIYTLRYRVKNSQMWTVLSGLTTTFRFLNGLQPTTDYDIEVQYSCPNQGPLSDFSTGLIREFRTTGNNLCSAANPAQNVPVPIPGGVYIDNITSNSAILKWNSVSDAAGYIVSWGVANTNPASWPQAVVCNPTTQFTISGLVSGIEYSARVRTNCSNCTTASQSADVRSDFSAIQRFRTLTFRDMSLTTSDASGTLTVYPNPNRGTFTVSLPSGEGSFNLQLTDITGREVWSGLELSGSELSVALEGYASGVYVLQAVRGMEQWHVKVVVE